jgi:hypothetical protein
MKLLTQLVEPHLVDEPFHRALYFSSRDLRLRVVAVGNRDDADAKECEPPDGALAFDLITRKAAQVIDDQDVELAAFSRAQHVAVLGPGAVGTADGFVRELPCDRPAFVIRTTSAVAKSILDAGGALLFARIARVGNCAGGRGSGVVALTSLPSF